MQRSNEQNKDVKLKDIIFVRHGETDWSWKDLPKGEQDLPLNQNGRKQAKSTAIFLTHLLNDAINPTMVSSTLERALQTASIISDATGIAISETKEGLREFYDYTKIKGLTELPPNAETKETFHKRISLTIQELSNAYPDADPLIVVSHNKVFSHLAKRFTQQKAGLPFAGIANFKWIDDSWELEILNLEASIKKLPVTLMQDLFPKKQEKPDDNIARGKCLSYR